MQNNISEHTRDVRKQSQKEFSIWLDREGFWGVKGNNSLVYKFTLL